MLIRRFKTILALAAFALTSTTALAFGEELSSSRAAYGGYYDDVITCSGCSEDFCDAVGCTDDTCCGCASSCNSCCCDGLLGGLIKPSDHCYDDFISPITNPVFFEDPRNLTEARIIFLNHWLPNALGGGDVQLIAAQFRAAITDRLSIVAAKDGFIIAEDTAPLDDGWADLAVGLKYNLYADPCCGTLLSAGASYELPIGSTRALQGNGDGEFHLYLTGGKRIGSEAHWLSATGFRLPVDTTDENQVWYWSNHLDRHIGCGFYLLGEVNWYHTMKSGGQAAFNNLNGVDLFNFGGTNTAGNDIVTGALGVKYKPNGNREIGIAYETHLTDRRGVLEDRLTIDYIIRY